MVNSSGGSKCPILVALACLAVLGCRDLTESALLANPCSAAQTLRSSPNFLTVPEEADITARVIPGGFGGMFQQLEQVNTVGHLVVFLKDLSVADASRNGLNQVMACNGSYPGWLGVRVTPLNVEFRQGQYDGTELLGFLRKLEQLRNDPDVWAMQEDPETNRIWIGIGSGIARIRIEAAVAATGVPARAVTIEPPPPESGPQPFVVQNAPVLDNSISAGDGLFSFSLRVRYTNLQSTTRYPDWCLSADPDVFVRYFLYTIERWDGLAWKEVYTPVCDLVLFAPRSIRPGETQTDSVPVNVSRQVNTGPVWRTARLTGTYRFVGRVYRSTTSVPPFLSDPAPIAEQVSSPFRIVTSSP